MRSSNPTGTIPQTARAVLTVLEATIEEESFTREEALVTLSADEYVSTADQETAELVQPFTRSDYEEHLETLVSNGYLYAVDGQLHITP